MEKQQALDEFSKRKANAPKRIRNEDLYAGSPMYFYCKHCGHISDVLPESYSGIRPSHVCDFCKELVNKGWI